MSAVVYRLPGNPTPDPTKFDWALQGARVQNRRLEDVFGRLTGWYRYQRGYLWYQLETQRGGVYWSLSHNLAMLGPIPMTAEGGAA